MSSQTFTPTNPVDMSKEKLWGGDLGLLDWDSTRIVFTKRSLIEFLKYTGTTVDTNFSNISKLPRYATFGKLSEGIASADDAKPFEEAVTISTPTSAATFPAPVQSAGKQPAPASTNTFRPSRRVRTAPGGETHDIFGTYDDDALSSAPPKRDQAPKQAEQDTNLAQGTHTRSDSFADEPQASKPAFRPSRRVRERPGGKDNISDILFGPM
ncbi:hypothetical protein BDY19DRAFT_1053468 [Irpex rosettiformis]|uniref:Uncharacterized protein n=1 Tax=Irpex rosettiformis TaxID=378272 RepID=A0ACB8UIF1_9APHY|nr:hypothetical protein BDY19DRAFT_1053468 [Irpex rosettiformis]